MTLRFGFLNLKTLRIVNKETNAETTANENGPVSGETLEVTSTESFQTADDAGMQSDGGTSAMDVILTKADIANREKWEKMVDRGYKTLIEIAEALHRIKTYKGGILYKEYASFEEYCKERWSYNKSQAYRLVETGEFLEALATADSPHGESDCHPVKRPRNEIQVRALAQVPKELRVPCWMDIVTHRDPSELSRRDVEAEVRLFLQRKRIQKNSSPARPTVIGRAKRKIAELKLIIEKLDDPEKFESVIAELLELVDAAAGSSAIEVVVDIENEPNAQCETGASHDGGTHISFGDVIDNSQQAIEAEQRESALV